MARSGASPRCLLLSFAAFLLASDCERVKGAGGVFMLIEGGRYTFNATAAAAACRSLNVTMATRAQMERALQRGLETCKFGWIAETIAVVPRRTADDKCGKGKTGVVTWFARADQKFGVFCFNASDLEGTPNGSTSGPHGSTQPSTPTAPTQTSRPATTPLRPASGSPPSMKPVTTRAPEETSFTSALLIQTSHSTSVSSSSSSPTLKPFSTHIPTSLSPLITSKPTVVSLVFSTSASTFSLSSESGTTGATKPPLGNVPTALILLGVIALLLAAAGGVWCYKLDVLAFRSRAPQKDDVETEMWKHTDSEVDLQSRHEGEEEEDEDEADRKYSSDVTLCVNPDFKTNPSQ